jgi:hypothetical protein
MGDQMTSVHGLEYEQEPGRAPAFDVRGSAADREDPPEVHGRDLKVSLGGEVWLYGFACPTHGLRYYAASQPGEPLSAASWHPFTTVPGERDLEAGDFIVCQVCRSPLAWACGQDDPCNDMLVPAQALVSLRRLASVLQQEAT